MKRRNHVLVDQLKYHWTLVNKMASYHGRPCSEWENPDLGVQIPIWQKTSNPQLSTCTQQAEAPLTSTVDSHLVTKLLTVSQPDNFESSLSKSALMDLFNQICTTMSSKLKSMQREIQKTIHHEFQKEVLTLGSKGHRRSGNRRKNNGSRSRSWPKFCPHSSNRSCSNSKSQLGYTTPRSKHLHKPRGFKQTAKKLQKTKQGQKEPKAQKCKQDDSGASEYESLSNKSSSIQT